MRLSGGKPALRPAAQTLGGPPVALSGLPVTSPARTTRRASTASLMASASASSI